MPFPKVEWNPGRDLLLQPTVRLLPSHATRTLEAATRIAVLEDASIAALISIPMVFLSMPVAVLHLVHAKALAPLQEPVV